VSRGILPDLRQEIELALPVEVSTLLATGKTNSANEVTVSGPAEKKDDVKGERKEPVESMMA
jgi:hypothetical protein